MFIPGAMADRAGPCGVPGIPIAGGAGGGGCTGFGMTRFWTGGWGLLWSAHLRVVLPCPHAVQGGHEVGDLLFVVHASAG